MGWCRRALVRKARAYASVSRTKFKMSRLANATINATGSLLKPLCSSDTTCISNLKHRIWRIDPKSYDERKHDENNSFEPIMQNTCWAFALQLSVSMSDVFRLTSLHEQNQNDAVAHNLHYFNILHHTYTKTITSMQHSAMAVVSATADVALLKLQNALLDCRQLANTQIRSRIGFCRFQNTRARPFFHDTQSTFYFILACTPWPLCKHFNKLATGRSFPR
jgi:hypothetical protein